MLRKHSLEKAMPAAQKTRSHAPRPSRKKAGRKGKLIGILSRKRSLYTTGRLVAAARARGHRAQVLDILRCTLSLGKSSPAILYEGKAGRGFDVVIPRIGA